MCFPPPERLWDTVRWVEGPEKVKLKFLQGKMNSIHLSVAGAWRTVSSFLYLGSFYLGPFLFLQAGFSSLSLWSCFMITQGEWEMENLTGFLLRPVYPYTLSESSDCKVHLLGWFRASKCMELQESRLLLLLSTLPVGSAGSSSCKDQNNSPLWGALSHSLEMTPLFLWGPGCVVNGVAA